MHRIPRAWRNAWRGLVTSVKMRSDAEAEGENEIFVEETSPTEAEKPPEAPIYTDVKVGVLQVYGCRPIAGAKEKSDVQHGVHPEVWRIHESLIQPLEVDDRSPTAVFLRDDE